ncbi:hypothetical protein CO173_04110 [Candidatus Uhrbacteria bacterium CG_4_9_14_3_um_filter_41_35]|uniref:Clp R domain-containing protein n=1 Tax=Candidatus Uhrbacteria bacterium CG_4_9_14_3_um_filter_41_35 TaxID=1975034 RepID=A0A2M7XDN2_9BACT|nr:MAG: hypothetical protein COV92_00125 [Candidatus Uhrbacteria bacterium CG11_big_fil_rev_8_21_14_0_20_41_9]PJA45955.1 MAG: hypothetical protein CO173_04110 [Candidatus Uhrbacteria bacterium CG_4_9_14_3_um_filter_41_35]
MDDIISKFTTHLKTALTRALCIVIEGDAKDIDPAHLLFALGTQEGCVAFDILEKTGITKADLRKLINLPENFVEEAQAPKNFIPALSQIGKLIIEKAVLTASVYEHKYVGTEHLLFAILQSKDEKILTFFAEKNIDLKVVQTNLSAVFKTTQTFPETEAQSLISEIEAVLNSNDDQDLRGLHDHDELIKIPALDFFTEELTSSENIETIDPVIGRDAEILRLMKILSRRTKNNPILIGEPGVGKTAIIEGLARKISEGDVPNILSGKKIHRLDLASLIAGTMYRGEFENRLRQLVDEVAEREDVILFIDEVHTIMGAGSASGSLDVANILKPALARGEIRCIGATTSAEYKKFIETDGALERRFEPIRVSEPSEEKTKEILQGILKFYEEFHNVTYTETAIEASIKYAGRYLTHKNFPDKAIDLLDEAGASVNVKRKDDQKTPDSTVLTERLKQITAEKNEAVMAENFAKAVELKDEETKILLAIDKIILAPPQKPLTVSDEDIIEVVAEITGIPLQKISQKEYKQLDNFEKELKKSVFGQVETVARVAQAIRRARLDIQPTNQPLSSFLFVGPSGVGKTELAKAIAKNLFHDQKAFLRLDMSEYSDKFTASKLIGAPAGYVGYRESSLLTDHVKEHPHSVVLFDEIEKAHPDIHNLLLQILDNGMITDATGRKVNFRNAVIIMTSNVGSMRFEQSGLGFSEKENTELLLNADLRKLLETSFSKEFLNRINHTCVFRPLDNKILKAILKKELKALSVRLQNKSANLKWTPEIEKYLLKKITPKFGARDVKRIVEQEIEHHLTDTLLKQTTSVPFSLELGILKNGKLFIKTKKIR